MPETLVIVALGLLLLFTGAVAAVIRMRGNLIETRTRLVTSVRGVVKARV